MDDIFEQVETELRKRYYGWPGAKYFEGTGARLAREVEEFCWPSEKIDEEIKKHFKAVEVCTYEELLTVGPIKVWTLCPHHLLPCRFSVYIGYVPKETVLGLSKFSRIAVTLAKRPIIQEMYTQDLVDVIKEHLQPKGVAVAVIGEHGCMRCRGVQQEATVTTTVLKDLLEYRAENRAEFLAMVRGGNGK